LNRQFANTPSGNPQLVFLLVFLPSWRIWDSMREFLNNYYMDDMIQRAFTFWILVLSVFYGNQVAYLPEDINQIKNWIISIYLVIHFSFLGIELIYSIFIVWLRKLVFFQWILRMPSLAMWIVAIQLNGWRVIGPIFGAIWWEYICPIIIDSKWADKFTPIEYRKAIDTHHFQSRLSSFFIIILGEGVLQLIKNGPLGSHLHDSVGYMAWVLLIYYEFSFLYFNRDGSRLFIPAASSRRNARTVFWVFCHIPLFGSVLIFAAGVMFILRNQPDAPINSAEGGSEDNPLTGAELMRYIHRAIWTCAISLGTAMLSITAISLCDQSLDEPGTLKITNRYVRLSMRGVFIALVVLLPLAHIAAQLYLGIVAMMLLVVGIWEWNSSLERGGSLVEPKGISMMMSRELKS
jgi:low temperature requirement protein LtrA